MTAKRAINLLKKLQSTPFISVKTYVALNMAISTLEKLENGTLIDIDFPCKIGDTVYYDSDEEDENGELNMVIKKAVIDKIEFDNCGTVMFCCGKKDTIDYFAFYLPALGDSVFFTKEELERHLKEQDNV